MVHDRVLESTALICHSVLLAGPLAVLKLCGHCFDVGVVNKWIAEVPVYSRPAEMTAAQYRILSAGASRFSFNSRRNNRFRNESQRVHTASLIQLHACSLENNCEKKLDTIHCSIAFGSVRSETRKQNLFPAVPQLIRRSMRGECTLRVYFGADKTVLT